MSKRPHENWQSSYNYYRQIQSSISKNRTIIAVITIAAVRKIAAGITQGFPDQTTTP
jgi:hypothetical protein